MSQIKLGMRSLRILSSGRYELMKSKISFLTILLMLLLFSLVGAQPYVTHSNGKGPLFEVYPAVVVPQNGKISLTFFSSETDVEYSILLNGEKKVLEDGKYSFKLERFYNPYTYLTIKAHRKGDPWYTSSATVIVLSPKIRYNADKAISVFASPTSFGSSNFEGKVYVILNPLLGKKRLQLYVDKNLFFERTLSAFSDAPRVIEAKFDTRFLRNGTHNLNVHLFLTPDQEITESEAFTVQRNFSATLREVKVTPTVLAPKKMHITAVVKIENNSNFKIKNVWINDATATYKNESWSATFLYDFTNVKESGNYPLSLKISVMDEVGNMMSATVSKEMCVDANPPFIKSEISKDGHTYSLNEGKTIVFESWQLPSIYRLNMKIDTRCKSAKTKLTILYDGKKFFEGTENELSKDITVNSYGTHTLTVKAVDLINNMEQTYNYRINVKKPLLPVPWWILIGILGSMIILAFLTFY